MDNNSLGLLDWSGNLVRKIPISASNSNSNSNSLSSTQNHPEWPSPQTIIQGWLAYWLKGSCSGWEESSCTQWWFCLWVIAHDEGKETQRAWVKSSRASPMSRSRVRVTSEPRTYITSLSQWQVSVWPAVEPFHQVIFRKCLEPCRCVWQSGCCQVNKVLSKETSRTQTANWRLWRSRGKRAEGNKTLLCTGGAGVGDELVDVCTCMPTYIANHES